MPVRRRDPKRRTGLTPALRHYLLDGWTLTGDEPTPEAAEAAWREHGAALTAFWQSDPAAWFAAGNKAHFYNPAPRGPGALPWYATVIGGST